MRNLVGPIPEPEDLHGRKKMVADAWRLLPNHNLLLLAPRRFGKSGIIRHLLRRPQHGFLPLSFDLEDVTTAAAFVQRVVEKSGERKELRPLLKRCGDVVSDVVDAISEKVESIDGGSTGLPGIKLRRSVADSDWQPLARKIMLSLELASQPLLFLFDELPEMLRKVARAEGEDAARRFLHWLRTVRLDDRGEMRRHRFVVAGSTGLNYLLDARLGCPETLNDFQRLPVEPLEIPDAVDLCRQLAAHNGLEVSDTTIEYMLVRIGQPVPYFIQLLFSAIAQDLTPETTTLTEETIDVAYKKRLMGPICKRYFDQYRRRLEHYPEELEPVVIHLLVEAARAENGIDSPRLYQVYAAARGPRASGIEFCELLADLECDWYLRKDPDKETYTFYMNVMKDWWSRWYSSIRDTSPMVVNKTEDMTQPRT